MLCWPKIMTSSVFEVLSFGSIGAQRIALAWPALHLPPFGSWLACIGRRRKIRQRGASEKNSHSLTHARHARTARAHVLARQRGDHPFLLGIVEREEAISFGRLGARPAVLPRGSAQLSNYVDLTRAGFCLARLYPCAQSHLFLRRFEFVALVERAPRASSQGGPRPARKRGKAKVGRSESLACS